MGVGIQGKSALAGYRLREKTGNLSGFIWLEIIDGGQHFLLENAGSIKVWR